MGDNRPEKCVFCNHPITSDHVAMGQKGLDNVCQLAIN